VCKTWLFAVFTVTSFGSARAVWLFLSTRANILGKRVQLPVHVVWPASLGVCQAKGVLFLRGDSVGFPFERDFQF
jgi:hypothetical protein